MSEEKLTLQDLKNEGKPQPVPVVQEQPAAEPRKVDISVLAERLKSNAPVSDNPEDQPGYNKIQEALEKYGYAARNEVLEQAIEIIDEIKMEEEIESSGTNDMDFTAKVTYDEPEEIAHQETDHANYKRVQHNINNEDPVDEEGEVEESDTTDEYDVTDYDEDEDDPITEMDRDEYISIVKSEIGKKIKPVTDAVNLSTFKIVNNPISSMKAFMETDEDNREEVVADWALVDTGVMVSMREFKGYEIEKLNPNNNNLRNEYNTFKTIYKLIYDHIVNENKPPFEAFLKFIKFTDIDNLYFSIFLSSFDDKYITYTCPKCNNVHVHDVKLEDMYEVNKDYKSAFSNIMSSGSEFTLTGVENELVQISNNYAVSLRIPSVFNVIFEPLSLSPEYRESNLDILELLTFIENIYFIDRKNNGLRPISYKVDNNSLTKTIKNRLLHYSKIIDSFNSDQYTLLTSCIDKISPKKSIKYYIPEAKCTKCNSIIPKEETSPQVLLFTRRQLAAFQNM